MTELTDALRRERKALEKCHICFEEFAHSEPKGHNDLENRKVTDHCHYTGLYRGAAHINCNLKY